MFDMAHAFPAFQSFALLSGYCIEERKIILRHRHCKKKSCECLLIRPHIAVFIGNVYEDDANY